MKTKETKNLNNLKRKSNVVYPSKINNQFRKPKRKVNTIYSIKINHNLKNLNVKLLPFIALPFSLSS